MKKENAVTLVALVITIIIMLILATLSIQALTNTGLFESANKAKLETKRGQISETLGLKTMLEQSNNPGGTAEEIITATRNNVIQNKNELEKIGKDVNIEDISTEEDGEKADVYFYVVVDKDVYKVDMSGSKFIGELGKLLPTIKIKNLTNTTNSITIEVKTSRNEGGKIEYYIKAEDEDKYELKETKTDDSEYTYGDLIQGKKYNIKVIAKAENGQTAEVIAEQTTGSIANLTAGDIIFTYTVDGKVIDKNTWTNGKVKVSAKINPEIDMTGLKIQTSKDGKKYENTDTQTFTENGTMYVVLTDGKNYGGSAGGTVTNIDKTRPIITEATATTNSISIKATDEESGIAGYAVTKTSEQPKSEEFTSVDSTKEFSITINNQIQGTTYYAWVRDQAGNVSEVKTLKTENVTNLIKDVNLTFSYSTTEWTRGDVTVTANTTISGYTLQTSKDGINWENTATQIFSDNGMIYARLWDGINYGGTAIGNITTIDRTVPTISDISFRGNFSNTYYAICTRGTKGKVYISIDGGNTYITGNREEWIIVNYGTNYNHNLIVKLIDDAGNVSSEYTYSMTPKIVLGIQLYNGAFGRDIYVTEAEWARNYTIKDILNNIYTSTECEQKNPDNSSKVYALYRGIMGREPDSSGYQAHLAGLNNGNTLQYYATSVFLYSQEFKVYLSNNGLKTTD